jgi:hypothetical protein
MIVGAQYHSKTKYLYFVLDNKRMYVLQISSNIPSILSSCSRLFAIKNTHFARNVIFDHVSAKNSWLQISRLRQVIVVLINVY